MTAPRPKPTDIKLHQRSRILEVTFDDGAHFEMTTEFLRVYSPSAEVRGHGPGQEVLQVGKENVNITAIDMVGNYAVKLTFDDGHDTGIYSWEELYRLGTNQQTLFTDYLQRLADAGEQRNTSPTNGAGGNGAGRVIKI